MKDLIERLREWNRQYRGTIMDDVLEATDALEQAQARIAELEEHLKLAIASHRKLHQVQQQKNAALALQVEQMREALVMCEDYLNGPTAWDDDQYSELQDKIQSVLSATPNEALAEYRRKVKVETIEECAAIVRNKICFKLSENSPHREIAHAALDEICALAAALDGDKVEKEVG